jgi:hypothetical protein
MTYFFIIVSQLNESKNKDSKPVVNALVGILVSAFIVFLDFLAIKIIDSLVSLEVHFSSVGRNWKRIAYIAAFIICNILAVILAYCSAQPVAIKAAGSSLNSDTVFSIDDWKTTTYQKSYEKWRQSCSSPPYKPPDDVVSDLSSRKNSLANFEVQNTINLTLGFWHHFTSQSVDGRVIPTFAAFVNDRDPNQFSFIRVGCGSNNKFNKFICSNTSDDIGFFDKRYDYVDSCDFIRKISNISLADNSIPSILFGASIYSLPWSISSSAKEFRLSLFAEEGSLYGFLFAFIFIKAFRMVLYYIYNDVVSIISHRLLLPLLKRQGHDTKVSLEDHDRMFICLKSSIIHKHQHLDQHMPCLF